MWWHWCLDGLELEVETKQTWYQTHDTPILSAASLPAIHSFQNILFLKTPFFLWIKFVYKISTFLWFLITFTAFLFDQIFYHWLRFFDTSTKNHVLWINRTMEWWNKLRNAIMRGHRRSKIEVGNRRARGEQSLPWQCCSKRRFYNKHDPC